MIIKKTRTTSVSQKSSGFKTAHLFALLLLISSAKMYANDTTRKNLVSFVKIQASITGTVVDSGGLPLPGASIVEKGTTNGTQTDFDGNFSIEVPENAILVISYIGYTSQKLPVMGKTTVDVTLEENASQLEEVVLVGYGTQSRVDVTNAISSVKSEDLVETPAIGVSQALQGRAAGIQVQNSGAPGSSPLVTIRGLGTFGNNSPLFVVDGVPTGSLNDIPAESIESVDILKDASSAAIYGSRGSNGVVLIKTKGGKFGKTKFTFSTYAGLATNSNTLDLLNADQYRQYASEVFDADGNTPGNQIYPNLQPGVVDPTVDTDWQDAIFKTGLIQNYNIQATGGTENVTYSVRSGYLKQGGTTIETDFQRYSLGINTSIKLSDKITIGETLNLGYTRGNNVGEASDGNALRNALKFDPTKPVFEEASNFFSELSTDTDGQDAENPVRILSNGSRVSTGTSIVGSLFGRYELLPGLTYSLTIGLDHSYTNFDQFDKFIPTGSRQRLESLTRKNRDKFLGTVITNTLNYATTFNDLHNFDILAGYERNKSNFENTRTLTANTLTEIVEALNVGDVRELTSFNSENNLHSVFGRVSYDYDNIFLLSGTFRADGSSRFTPQNRWGYFPSGSAGVNLSKLPFLVDNETVSNLKIRGSYGITGNNNIGDYLYSSGLQTDFNYVFDGSLASGTRPVRLVSDDLKWEEITSYNIGLDVGLFNNAFTLTAEYYNNKSDGLLVDVPLPVSAGDVRGNVTQNVGGTETDGIELIANYSDNEGDFTWGINVNAATASAEVTSLGNATAILNGSSFGQNHNRLSVGEAPFHFFGLQTDGIFQDQAEVDEGATQNQPDPEDAGSLIGHIRYVDTNGDGTINADDRVVIGNPTPDVTMGLDFNFKYKNIDFSAFFNGVYGNEIYNALRYDTEQQSRLFNLSTVVLNRWSPANTGATVPIATPTFTGDEVVSERFIEDGSYTRLRSVTLGYTVPLEILARMGSIGLSNVRVYISGQNLATWTDYSGYDPEIVPQTTDGSVTALGLDTGRYPQPKTILAGLQVQF